MAGQKKRPRDDRGEKSELRAGLTATATVQGSSDRTRGQQGPSTTSPTGQRQGGGGTGRGLDMISSGSGAPATPRRRSIEHPGLPDRPEQVVVPSAAGELVPAEAEPRGPISLQGRDARAEAAAASGADAPPATLPADRPFIQQRTRGTIFLDRLPAKVDFKKKPSVVEQAVPAPPQQCNATTETNLSLLAGISSSQLPPKKRYFTRSSTGGPDEAMSP